MDRSSRVYPGRAKCRRKVIPWHCQQRYLSDLSNITLNHTLTTASYKSKIKSLLKNNKYLALALQNSRFDARDMENLQLQNLKNIDIINFSRYKLLDMESSMKKAFSSLNETLELLKMNVSTVASAVNPNVRADFKCRLKDISIDPIEEIPETENDFCTENTKRKMENCKTPAQKKPKVRKSLGIKKEIKREKESTPEEKRKNQKEREATIKYLNSLPELSIREMKAENVEDGKTQGSKRPQKDQLTTKLKSKKKSIGHSKLTEPPSSQENTPGLTKDQESEIWEAIFTGIAETVQKRPSSFTKGGNASLVRDPGNPIPKTSKGLVLQSKKNQHLKKVSKVPQERNVPTDDITLTPTSPIKLSSKIKPNTAKKRIDFASCSKINDVAVTDAVTVELCDITLNRSAGILKRKSQFDRDSSVMHVDGDSDTLSRSYPDDVLTKRGHAQIAQPIRSGEISVGQNCKSKVRFSLAKEDTDLQPEQNGNMPVKSQPTRKRPLNNCTEEEDLCPISTDFKEPVKKKPPVTDTECKKFFDVVKFGNSLLVTAEVHQPPGGCAPNASRRSSRKSQNGSSGFCIMQPSIVLTDIFEIHKPGVEVLTAALESTLDPPLNTVTDNDHSYPDSSEQLQKSSGDSDFETPTDSCNLKTPTDNSDLRAPIDVSNPKTSADGPDLKIPTDSSSTTSTDDSDFKPAHDDEEVIDLTNPEIDKKGERRSRKTISYKEPSLIIKMRRPSND